MLRHRNIRLHMHIAYLSQKSWLFSSQWPECAGTVFRLNASTIQFHSIDFTSSPLAAMAWKFSVYLVNTCYFYSHAAVRRVCWSFGIHETRKCGGFDGFLITSPQRSFFDAFVCGFIYWSKKQPSNKLIKPTQDCMYQGTIDANGTWHLAARAPNNQEVISKF